MKVLHGTVLFTVLTVVVAGGNDFRSDYKYYSGAQGWFKLHKVPANWEDARIRCSLEGAVLASPINEAIRDVMYNIISKEFVTQRLSSGLHTGVHNTLTPTQYNSLEGVPLSDMPVDQTFTTEYNAQLNCMRLVSTSGLVPSYCNDTRPYLCYKEKTADLVITECGTVDTGYQLNSTTGHCYKFHRGALTWSYAFSTCEAEGGYLAVVNSDAEASLVNDLIAQNPVDTILGPNKQGTLLGFYDWTENNIWRTIHGESLDDAGFAQWNSNQPDNYLSNGEGQHCGSMARTGLLDDVWCSHVYAFICEKDPKSLRPSTRQW